MKDTPQALIRTASNLMEAPVVSLMTVIRSVEVQYMAMIGPHFSIGIRR